MGNSGFSQNQQKIDSLVALTYSLPEDTNLVNTYEKIAILYLKLQFDCIKAYAQKMIELSEQLGYDKGLAKGYNWKGEAYMWQANYTKDLECYKKTTNIFSKKGKRTLWAKSLEVMQILL